MKPIRRFGWLAALALLMAPVSAGAATIRSNVVTVTGGYYPITGYQQVPIQQCGWQTVQTGTTQQCQQVQVGTQQQCQYVQTGTIWECSPSGLCYAVPTYSQQCTTVPVYQQQCTTVPVYQTQYVCVTTGYSSYPVYGSWVPTKVS